MKSNLLLCFVMVLLIPCTMAQVNYSSKEVLYEQMNVFSAEPGVASQFFPDEPDLTCGAADDFVVPLGENWMLENIFVPGYYTSSGVADLVNIYIYHGMADLPGPIFFSLMGFPVPPDPSGNLDIMIPPLMLPPGSYWISIQPVMNYYGSGQWLWKKQDSPTIAFEFSWQNPGGGWFGNFFNWVPSSLVWGPSGQTDWNLSFRLTGQRLPIIPPPFINDFFPLSCYPGKLIHLYGNNFLPFSPASFIEVNGIPFHDDEWIWLDDHIIFEVPSVPVTDSIDIRILNGPFISNTIRLAYDIPETAVITTPGANEILSGNNILINVRPSTWMRLIDTAFFYYQEPGQQDWTLIGIDTCGKSMNFGAPQPGGPGDGWSYNWNAPIPLPDTFNIRVAVRDREGNNQQAATTVRYDPDPPIPAVADSSKLVANLALNADSLVVIFAVDPKQAKNASVWAIRIPMEGSRTLDTCNQYKLGATDYNLEICDSMACGPTAGASCLKWLAKNHNPGSELDNMGTRDVAKELVDESDTDAETGTVVEDLVGGMQTEYKDRTGDSLEVETNDPRRDMLLQILNRFNQKEDVMIGLTQAGANGDSVGHMVTLSSYHVTTTKNVTMAVPKPRVSTSTYIDIDFMDPATGKIDTFSVIGRNPPRLVGYNIVGGDSTKAVSLAGALFAKPSKKKSGNLPDTLFLASVPLNGPGLYKAIIPLDSLSEGIYFLDVFIDSLASDPWCHSYALAFVAPYEPLALFSADHTMGYPPFDVQFINYSSPIDSLTYFKWDFGDGDTSNLENPVHTYDIPGVYDVSLVVSDGTLSDTLTWTDYIHSGITLDLNACLEGPFNGSSMDTLLNTAKLIPLNQPFNIPPWNYYGTEAVDSIPNPGIVDWVLIGLRDASSAANAVAATTIDRMAAFLLSNGDIAGTDGRSLPWFNATFNSNLFVVLQHRNHLGILSADPLTVENGIFPYDFTTASAKVFGGINGHKQVAAGKWAMFSGDGDSNGQVNLGDKIEIWRPQVGSTGYLQGDYNLNGQVDNTDKNLYWRPNAGRGSQVPE